MPLALALYHIDLTWRNFLIIKNSFLTSLHGVHCYRIIFYYGTLPYCRCLNGVNLFNVITYFCAGNKMFKYSLIITFCTNLCFFLPNSFNFLRQMILMHSDKIVFNFSYFMLWGVGGKFWFLCSSGRLNLAAC